MSAATDIYGELLLDLYKHPLNKQTLSDFDVSQKEHNPLCGDTVELFIKWNKNGTVENVGWQGEGCAISQAASSLLTEETKNKTKIEIKNITSEKILEMLGLQNLNPTRLRCATLSLECLKSIIHNS